MAIKTINNDNNSNTDSSRVIYNHMHRHINNKISQSNDNIEYIKLNSKKTIINSKFDNKPNDIFTIKTKPTLSLRKAKLVHPNLKLGDNTIKHEDFKENNMNILSNKIKLSPRPMSTQNNEINDSIDHIDDQDVEDDRFDDINIKHPVFEVDKNHITTKSNIYVPLVNIKGYHNNKQLNIAKVDLALDSLSLDDNSDSTSKSKIPKILKSKDKNVVSLSLGIILQSNNQQSSNQKKNNRPSSARLYRNKWVNKNVIKSNDDSNYSNNNKEQLVNKLLVQTFKSMNNNDYIYKINVNTKSKKTRIKNKLVTEMSTQTTSAANPTTYLTSSKNNKLSSNIDSNIVIILSKKINSCDYTTAKINTNVSPFAYVTNDDINSSDNESTWFNQTGNVISNIDNNIDSKLDNKEDSKIDKKLAGKINSTINDSTSSSPVYNKIDSLLEVHRPLDSIPSPIKSPANNSSYATDRVILTTDTINEIKRQKQNYLNLLNISLNNSLLKTDEIISNNITDSHTGSKIISNNTHGNIKLESKLDSKVDNRVNSKIDNNVDNKIISLDKKDRYIHNYSLKSTRQKLRLMNAANPTAKDDTPHNMTNAFTKDDDISSNLISQNHYPADKVLLIKEIESARLGYALANKLASGVNNNISSFDEVISNISIKPHKPAESMKSISLSSPLKSSRIIA